MLGSTDSLGTRLSQRLAANGANSSSSADVANGFFCVQIIKKLNQPNLTSIFRSICVIFSLTFKVYMQLAIYEVHSINYSGIIIRVNKVGCEAPAFQNYNLIGTDKWKLVWLKFTYGVMFHIRDTFFMAIYKNIYIF